VAIVVSFEPHKKFVGHMLGMTRKMLLVFELLVTAIISPTCGMILWATTRRAGSINPSVVISGDPTNGGSV
jgi:hypothetical protein